MSESRVRSTEAGIFYDQDAISLGLADAQTSFDEAVGEMHSQIRTAASVSKGVIMADATETTPIPVAAPPAPAAAPVTTPQPAPAPAPVAAPLPIAAAAGPSAADYEEIVALCTMARRPQLAAQFISERKTVAEVRQILLKQETDDDQESEIFSAFSGKAGVAESLTAAPKPREGLAARMKQRLGMEAR